LSERIYFNCKKLLSTSAEVTGAYLKQTADSVFIPINFCYAFHFFKLKSLTLSHLLFMSSPTMPGIL
ncbi:hypothetical protein T05_10912, partial [Trichinella murrelli]